tara:strand:- start:48 stop:1097 length:1050 start_codon:yes stop_codon:yes gene_type:complete
MEKTYIKTPIQRLAEFTDDKLGTSRRLQLERWKTGRTLEGTPLKQKNSKLTNLTRKQYLKEVNGWIQSNKQEWQKIRATDNYPWQTLQSKLEPHLGVMYWKRGDNAGAVATAGTGDTFTLYSAGKKGEDKAGGKSDIDRRSNRGKRSGNTIQYNVNDFIKWGRRNGYSDNQSIETYQRFELRNRQQQGEKPGPGFQNDHLKAHKNEYGNPGETYRNKLWIKNKTNGAKSDKNVTIKEMRDNKIPLSKSSMIRMEFRDIKPVPNSQLQQLTNKVANDPLRIRARDKNKLLDKANQKVMINKSNSSKGFKGGFGNYEDEGVGQAKDLLFRTFQENQPHLFIDTGGMPWRLG